MCICSTHGRSVNLFVAGCIYVIGFYVFEKCFSWVSLFYDDQTGSYTAEPLCSVKTRTRIQDTNRGSSLVLFRVYAFCILAYKVDSHKVIEGQVTRSMFILNSCSVLEQDNVERFPCRLQKSCTRSRSPAVESSRRRGYVLLAVRYTVHK